MQLSGLIVSIVLLGKIDVQAQTVTSSSSLNDPRTKIAYLDLMKRYILKRAPLTPFFINKQLLEKSLQCKEVSFRLGTCFDLEAGAPDTSGVPSQDEIRAYLYKDVFANEFRCLYDSLRQALKNDDGVSLTEYRKLLRRGLSPEELAELEKTLLQAEAKDPPDRLGDIEAGTRGNEAMKQR